MDGDSEARVLEQTRLGVWQSLYDQERLVRYYERLRDLFGPQGHGLQVGAVSRGGRRSGSRDPLDGRWRLGCLASVHEHGSAGILVVLLMSPFYRRAETNLATAGSIMASCRRQKTET